MNWAYLEPLFSSEAEIWPKKEKYFEILQRSIVRGKLKDALRPIPSFIFISSRDMAKNNKIFLKFNNIALCGIQNRRFIWAYSELLFHQKPRYGQKRKKYFEILQRSIVRH
ncbi:hypothetical protein PUN28_020607 [Cardiocondyla obscurior]|uniref:Uncharacterized protein n=1 Tax=Cardiocondyla obscurior TaxID=286306 RepID=A0AAW2E8M5_9HYME